MTEEMGVEPTAPLDDAAPTPEPTTPDAAPPAPAAAEAPRRRRLQDLKPGMTVTGTVKNTTDYGAFVDIGAEQDGMVHISELSEERVRRVEDVVRRGQTVEVTILDVDPRRRRISLSMKPRPESVEYTPPQDDEPVLSPMELAFRRAQEKRSRERQRNGAKTPRSDLDDILSRTLRQHRDRK